MPLLRSWVASANAPDSQFPLNNLPYGVFSRAGDAPRCGVAIGDRVLDLAAVEASGLLSLEGAPYFSADRWNPFMASGPASWERLRTQLTALLAEGAPHQDRLAPHLHAQAGVVLHLPISVAEYTDFYASRHHATNVGTMLRGAQNALPPNWLHIPIGYNGRASSIVVSGTDVRRPWGQLKGPNEVAPSFAPCRRMDFELELGAIVGQPSQGLIGVAEADAMIFGYVLLNDWSARDIQSWEYQPLGPFQAKASATSISPWIVTAAALAPFRVSTPPRELPLLAYLDEPGPTLFDIALEVWLSAGTDSGTRITQTNYREMYYSSAQQLAHHTSSGCPMRVGDLLGSGTISGADRTARGSLMELSWNGADPLSLPIGDRSFLEDGDRVTFTGSAHGDGYVIGFGDCTGRILPAYETPAGAGR